MKKGNYSPYCFYVDMSGCPWKDDLYLGCVFINDLYAGDFIKQFYEEFPHLKGFDKKSTNLNGETLKEVIAFMDKKRIRMTCLKFHKSKLAKYFKEIEAKKNKFRIKGKSQIHNFTGKILGILYYYLIKPYAYKKWHYGFEMCVESHVKTLIIMRCLNNLSHRDGYLLHPRMNYRRIQHMLKFADFIAGAGHKLDDFVLKSFKYMNYIMPEIDPHESDIAFGIIDVKYEKEKLLNSNNVTLSSGGTVGNDSLQPSEKTEILEEK